MKDEPIGAAAGRAGEILDPIQQMLMAAKQRWLLRHEPVDVHRQVNRKRLRPCCKLNEETGEVECEDISKHDKYTIGKKGILPNGKRKEPNQEQPYHNDPIMGQVVAVKRDPASVKYLKAIYRGACENV